MWMPFLFIIFEHQKNKTTMSTSLDCYKYAVGKSRTTCECFDDDKPSDYAISESGLYLDELEGLNLIYPKNAEDCGRGNLWEMMAKAGEEGAMYWRTAVMNYIGGRTVRKRNYFSGVIGDDRTNNTKTTLTKNFAGWTWKASTVRGGFQRIKRFGVFFESATPIDLILYDNESDTPIGTWNVTPTAGKVNWFTLPTPVTLSLVREVPRPKQFWLVYATAGVSRPIHHRITCACGELNKLNQWCDNPSFANLSTPQARYNWLEWVTVTGTTGDLITKRDDNWTHQNLAYGLMIDCEFICNTNDILCKDILDFDNDEIAMVQAYGLRYAQGEKLTDMILSSTKLNRFTMLEREAMYGKRNHFKKEMDTRAQYVAAKLTEPQRINLINDCFTCKNKMQFTLSGIQITDGKV